MLCRSRKFALRASQAAETPLLIPAFSSKALPDIGKVLKFTSEFVVGPVLLSAYDLHYCREELELPILFPELVVIDSGGYEVSKEAEVENSNADYTPRKWSPELLRQVWAGWPTGEDYPPTIIVNYDDPFLRIPVAEQIEAAAEQFGAEMGMSHEFLIKPERPPSAHSYVRFKEAILDNVRKFRAFHVIGITAKELGGSVLNRMLAIAEIRAAMDSADADAPIHIFGSLDTIETTLYFMAGAEIFDGLTWLRYAFCDGKAIYISHFGISERGLGIHETDAQIRRMALAHNVSHLGELTNQLRSFSRDGDLSRFGASQDFLKRAYDQFDGRRGH